MPVDLLACNHELAIFESDDGLTISGLYDCLQQWTVEKGPRVHGDEKMLRASRPTFDKIRAQIFEQTRIFRFAPDAPEGPAHIRLHSPFGKIIVAPAERSSR